MGRFSPWVTRNAPAAAQVLAQHRPTITAPDFTAIRQLVLAGQGIAVMPRYLVAQDLQCGTLTQVLPQLATLQVGVDCAVERGRRRTRPLEIFLQQLTGLAS